MGLMRNLVRTFAGGEVTPELVDRVDLGQQQTGLAKCINAIIYPQGVVAKRGGTRFVNFAKYFWQDEAGDPETGGYVYDRKIRLIKFQFSAEQSYVLEFGHKYVRFHTEGGTLLSGQSVKGERIRSTGVSSGTPKKLRIYKKDHGLQAGQKVYVTVSPSSQTGQRRGTIDASKVADTGMGGVTLALYPMPKATQSNVSNDSALNDVNKNDYWVVSVAGDKLLSRSLPVNYLVRAIKDDPYVKTTSTSDFSGTTMTVVSGLTGTYSSGVYLYGDGIPDNTYIVSGSGSTWTINNSVTGTGVSVTGYKNDPTSWEYVMMEGWDQFDGSTLYTVVDEDGVHDSDSFCIDVDSSLISETIPGKAFTAITRSTRSVCVCPSHGFSVGDTVYFTLTNPDAASIKLPVGPSNPYKVGTGNADNFYIMKEVPVSGAGGTALVNLSTTTILTTSQKPVGIVSLVTTTIDYIDADVEYSVYREAIGSGDTYTLEKHNLYTGQSVYLDTSDALVNSGYYEAVVLFENTYKLKDIGSGSILPVAAVSSAIYPIYEVQTDYDENDLALLDYAQSFDTLTLAHKKYPPSKLMRFGQSDWQFVNEVFAPNVEEPTNINVTVTNLGSSSPVDHFYAITCIQGNEESFPAPISRSSLDVARIGDTVQYNPFPLFLGTEFYNNVRNDEWARYNTSSSNTIKLASGTLNLGVTVRLSVSETAPDKYIDAVVGDSTNDSVYIVAARTTTGYYILKRRTQSVIRWGDISGAVPSGYVKVTQNGSISTRIDPTSGSKVDITWSGVSGARYNVYKRIGGYGGDALGFIGQTTEPFFTDSYIEPDYTNTPPYGANPFDDVGSYPSCVDYFYQRKVFAGTEVRPQNVWMTRTATDNNMQKSVPLKDTDSIEFRIAGREQNAIKFIAGIKDLILFSENCEWRASAAGGVLTPSTIMVEQQSSSGCADVKPVIASDSILFVQSGSNHVLNLKYNWNAQGYQPEDLSLIAAHLFEGYQIVDMTLERGMFPILWCVRSDGVMLALTYLPEQNVIAWHRHTTDGLFKSVTTVKEASGPVVYAAVYRNGRTLIERMDNYTGWRDREYMDAVHEVTIDRESMFGDGTGCP